MQSEISPLIRANLARIRLSVGSGIKPILKLFTHTLVHNIIPLLPLRVNYTQYGKSKWSRRNGFLAWCTDLRPWVSHVNYYSRYAGNDIRDMHKEFACTLCPFQSDDISEVVTHLESTHSAKYRIEVGSDDERQLTADNNYEKSQFILVLSQKDRPANPLYTRYRYWWPLNAITAL